jgi:hypothetical protein
MAMLTGSTVRKYYNCRPSSGIPGNVFIAAKAAGEVFRPVLLGAAVAEENVVLERWKHAFY